MTQLNLSFGSCQSSVVSHQLSVWDWGLRTEDCRLTPSFTEWYDALSRMKRRGFLNADVIWRLSFWTTAACIGVAVVASILAIWDFAGQTSCGARSRRVQSSAQVRSVSRG